MTKTKLIAAALLSICCVHCTGTAEQQPEEELTEVKPTVAEEELADDVEATTFVSTSPTADSRKAGKGQMEY